ncbi:hypothetical protein FJT64_023454 [Amphibalanus amphitrite]|uniref:Uncharacterized protein n=1 Tax=Amphibalanus amphitrite TaxID=1232801 RepID=A0A6A4WDR6_AMPAM|nr:hypothetical protein FJT64_023454 [Amphibalanus amphitrite]
MRQRRWHQELGLLMETDASGSVGLGAVLGEAWLFGSWPEFRRLRPRADHLPARWSWDAFDTVARRTP